MSGIDPETWSEAWEGLGELFEGFMFTITIAAEVVDLHDEAKTSVEDLIDSPADGFDLSTDASRTLIVYFTLVSEVLDELVSDAVVEHIIDGSIEREAIQDEVSEIGFYDCLDLLEAAGVIDSGVKGEIQSSKKARNTFVHDLENRFMLDDPEQTRADVDRAYRSVKRLVRVTYGEAYVSSLEELEEIRSES